MQPTLNGFTARNATLQMLVQEAFGKYEAGRVVGGPAWINSKHFDVDAKYDEDDVSQPRELTLEQRREELQALLADRFKLKVHTEHHEFPDFDLQLAKGGPKLKRSDPTRAQNLGDIKGFKSLVSVSLPGHLEGTNFTSSDLANVLQGPAGRFIVDQAGLTGRFDFQLRCTPDRVLGSEAPDQSTEEWPSLFTAMQEQLGLQLVASKTSLTVVVVDSAELPSSN